MGKETFQAVRVKCDRCGTTENTGDMTGRQEWGETDLTYSGHTGGMSWQGDSGGCGHKGKAWLCLACTRAFLAFMANRTTP